MRLFHFPVLHNPVRRFEFPIRLKKGDVLLFSFIGYNTEEYVVKDFTAGNIELNMALTTCVLLGEISIDEPLEVNERPTLKSRVKKFFN